jgi:hypothetical protein
MAVGLIPDVFLDQTASVFVESPAGEFTVQVKTGLRCRLIHVRGGESAGARAELLALRNMVFEPTYAMPEDCVVVVAGVRWRTRPGTFGALRGPDSGLSYRRCDVTRYGASG